MLLLGKPRVCLGSGALLPHGPHMFLLGCLSLDLEPGHKSPHIPQLLQDEDVCYSWDHPHAVWGQPEPFQPHVSPSVTVIMQLHQWGTPLPKDSFTLVPYLFIGTEKDL